MKNLTLGNTSFISGIIMAIIMGANIWALALVTVIFAGPVLWQHSILARKPRTWHIAMIPGFCGYIGSIGLITTTIPLEVRILALFALCIGVFVIYAVTSVPHKEQPVEENMLA